MILKLSATILISATAFPSPQVSHDEKSSPMPNISTDIPGRPGQVLVHAYEDFLRSLRASLTLPAKVVVVQDLKTGPRYDYEQRQIHAALPFTKTALINGQELKFERSLQDSIPIHLHEMVHQLMDVFFDTHMPMKLSTLIEDGELYFSYAPFEEFLADAIPVLYLKDPLAIRRSLDFGDPEIHRQSYFDRTALIDRDFTADIFSVDFAEFGQSMYGITLPTKVFVWQTLYPRLATQNPQIPFSELARRMIVATIASFKELSNNFTISPQLNGKTHLVNASLIKHLCREFSVSPCVAPGIGVL